MSRATIESSGSMSLVTDGTNYFLQPVGGAAVELSYGGAPVTAGQFGGWTPIAAAQTASGYEVAWHIPGADQYTIWYTDSSGNYLSSPFDSASGSSAQLESYEPSFNDDLNGDGVIGVPTSAQPLFAYQGTDANGVQLYDVTWSNLGSHPFAVRVLTPEHPSTALPHSFIYDLPVEPGLAQPTWGSGLDALQALDVENLYNATIIEPIFPIDSWYADNPTDPTIDYETFVADILPEWVDSNFATTGTEKSFLVGFSKSGYGALDLEFKYPSVFSAVAAFDFPGDMSSYDDYGSSSADDYGTQANFQDNYQLTDSFIDARKAPFTTEDRILISEGPVFGSQVPDFGDLLTSQGVIHTLLNQTNVAHSWSGGWLSGAIVGLYGLDRLNSGWDFNGDAKADILWQNANGDVFLWNSNSGSESFTGQDLGVVGGGWQIAGTGDFDAVGEAGILWRNVNGDTALWNANGSGEYAFEDLGVVGASWQVAGTGDFNGAGEGILWRDANGATALWNANGSGGFAYEDLGVVGGDWQIAGTDDFTGNGETSILWRNASGDTALWNPNGSGGFTFEDLGVVGGDWQIVGTGDFTGTGESSVLWRNANGDTALWNPNGSGGFAFEDLGVVGTSWQIVGAGDFTGTGESSILWRNASGDTALWNPNGSGGFAFQDLGVVGDDWSVHKIFA